MSSEAITKNDLKAVLDAILPPDMVDYIVEQGASGNWTYRKWNSGKAEAWYSTSGTLTIGTAAGSVYQTSANSTITLPSSLFTSVEYASVNLNYSSWGVWTYIASISTTEVQYRAMSASSRSSSSYGIRAYVAGAWK